MNEGVGKGVKIRTNGGGQDERHKEMKTMDGS